MSSDEVDSITRKKSVIFKAKKPGKIKLPGAETLQGQSKHLSLSGIWSHPNLNSSIVFLILAGTWWLLELIQHLINLSDLTLSGLDWILKVHKIPMKEMLTFHFLTCTFSSQNKKKWTGGKNNIFISTFSKKFNLGDDPIKIHADLKDIYVVLCFTSHNV